MKIHEYQGKELFKQYGVPVPEGRVAFTAEEAKNIAAEIGGKVVVKAQIHAGGRGKGGGVKLVNNPDEAFEAAKKILGMTLVTHQTGPEGKLVKKVLVEKASAIEKELYLSMVMDRSTEKVVIMGSEAGGMDIEEVAAKTPEKIIKVYVNPLVGISAHQARYMAFALNMTGDAFKETVKLIMNLYRMYMEKDCSLVEINPLILTADNHVFALDSKVNFDDSGLYRHKDIVELRDLDEEEPLEIKAGEYDLSYVKLDGKIGCMVNGAGLAMATMDIIKYAGSFPANFLDIGGKAGHEQVEAAFEILSSDPDVKAILINIFGGIVRCDMVAEGIISAAKKLDVKWPMVVRLKGTNSERARELLEGSGLKFRVAENMGEAAQYVVEAAEG